MSDPDRAHPRRSTERIWQLVAALAVVVAILALGWAIRCRTAGVAIEAPIADDEPLEDRRVLVPARFSDLPGWRTDRLSAARGALLESCDVFRRRDPDASLGPDGVGGRLADWLPLCEALRETRDEAAVRALLESELRPLWILNHDRAIGLFTGYYEPLLQGSRHRSDTYRIPLYRKPPDLVTVDLGAFHDRFTGRTISGRIGEETFLPYYDRDQIRAGALAERDLELVWVDDPIDAFFLHIQGSGRVRMAEGGEMRVGYGGQNGRPYFAIGRELVERGELALEDVSLQSIRAWLEANPEEAEEVMSTNRSFVFFRELEGEGPLGTLGVALTPGRSLAIDKDHLPLGAPLWIDTTRPGRPGEEAAPLRRLMVAQDTGGAIRGPVRGDVFWGHGDEAEWVAGHMKQEGRLWLLLPVAAVERLERP